MAKLLKSKDVISTLEMEQRRLDGWGETDSAEEIAKIRLNIGDWVGEEAVELDKVRKAKQEIEKLYIMEKKTTTGLISREDVLKIMDEIISKAEEDMTKTNEFAEDDEDSEED